MINILKKLGLRATPQRMAILEFLSGNTAHPSVEEIYRKLKPDYPSLSPATVYNTLEALAGAGEIQEITIDPQRRRFDPNPAPHCHFLCKKCRRVYDLDIALDSLTIPERLEDFKIQDLSLYLYGECPHCANN
ncbi:Fur family transcriptional regulator [Desulfoscipio geothermicus]|uniref:Fur family transcriptional regulator, peroxide stress response regulator n=1 Tax=Desulfoscipio geothermicus DSM 3669 TaxID=1121426 RepID=A0A1I6DP88_9FIRM|nr:Fur family transcriptional regulator [Desulfoscipio geothermicus]SFR07187.1 Fur family transcriptional regulator, peroxide stress response regulator [Desulfoscipio geothermicus DSM 3669]